MCFCLRRSRLPVRGFRPTCIIRSTWLFASTPGNRFTIFLISRVCFTERLLEKRIKSLANVTDRYAASVA